MTDQAAILDKLDAILQALKQQQEGGNHYAEHAEHLVEFEKLHGKLESHGTRIAAYEGNIQAQLSRLNHRLDELAQEIKQVATRQAQSDAKQQAEIVKLTLHSRYVMGIAAGIIFLINFFDKIRNFFTGGTP